MRTMVHAVLDLSNEGTEESFIQLARGAALDGPASGNRLRQFSSRGPLATTIHVLKGWACGMTEPALNEGRGK